jgi:DNA-binding NtrC family response regulator
MAHILVVGGNPDLRKLLQVLLRRQYTIAEALSVAAAMEPLRTSPEPLVMLWYVAWPQSDDLTLLTCIEQELAFQRHRFLLLTTNSEGLPQEIRQRLERLHIPIIRVPLDLDDFLQQVAAASVQADDQRRSEA